VPEKKKTNKKQKGGGQSAPCEKETSIKRKSRGEGLRQGGTGKKANSKKRKVNKEREGVGAGKT